MLSTGSASRDTGPRRNGTPTSLRRDARAPGCRTLLAAALGVAAAACGPSGPPTWADDVAPVVHENCTSCHRPGGPAPFSLRTYDEAAAVAELVAQAVSDGRMPPWLPSDAGPAFAGERHLSRGEVDDIVEWAAAGAPRGDTAAEPDPPTWPSGWALGEPDLVLTMDDTFPVPARGRDLFRNFVLPVPVEETRWVRAAELRPSNTRVVHHAMMRVDPTPSSRFADAQDSLPGFDDMFSRTEARPPGGFFLGWTPGRIPRPNPPGTAWRLEPGTDFIVQLHLRPTGQQETVAARVGLYFADRPPSRTPVIVRLGGQAMDIPPGDSAYVVEDRFRLPVAVRALGVYPHAHYLGRRMNVWAELPGGDSLTVIEIPDWDFNWQDAYRYEEPVELPAGTELRLRYVFDNSASNPQNPNQPPERVVYGPASTDEMAELWLQAEPVHTTDLATLQEALAVKSAEDRIEGWTHQVALDPGAADAQYGLGTVAQAREEWSEAERRYELALQAQPAFPQAHYNLGMVLEEMGDLDGAEAAYRDAVADLPDFPPAWTNLGRLLATEGDLDAARAALERAVAADPDHAEAQNNLGTVLRLQGATEQAETHFRAALARRPDYPEAHFGLAHTLVELGRAEEGLGILNRGLEHDGGNVQAAISVTWLLATHPDTRVRRPALAVSLADQIRSTAGLHPAVADLQAAAYASAGRFDRARALVLEGLAVARRTGRTERVAAMEARLELYRADRPYLEPPGR